MSKSYEKIELDFIIKLSQSLEEVFCIHPLKVSNFFNIMSIIIEPTYNYRLQLHGLIKPIYTPLHLFVCHYLPDNPQLPTCTVPEKNMRIILIPFNLWHQPHLQQCQIMARALFSFSSETESDRRMVLPCLLNCIHVGNIIFPP